MSVLQKICTLVGFILLYCKGVDTITLHLCRAANPTGHFFTISECSAAEVINIQSAEAGYSSFYDVSAPPLQCPWSNCTRPTAVPATLCNGVRRCRIRQEILLYPQGPVPALCDLSRDGNFIRIELTCNAETTTATTTTTTTMTTTAATTTTTTTTTTDMDSTSASSVSTATMTSRCRGCSSVMTTLNVNSSHVRSGSSQSAGLSTGPIAGIVIGAVILVLIIVVLMVVCFVCGRRERVYKYICDGKTTEATVERGNVDQNEPKTVDPEACRVAGRRAAVSAEEIDLSGHDDNDLSHKHADATAFDAYSTIEPTAITRNDSKSQPHIYSEIGENRADLVAASDSNGEIEVVGKENDGFTEEERAVKPVNKAVDHEPQTHIYSQVHKKPAAKNGDSKTTADDGAGKTEKAGKESDGVMEDDGVVLGNVNDISMEDDEGYATVPVPSSSSTPSSSSSPSATAEEEEGSWQLREPKDRGAYANHSTPMSTN